MVQDWDAGRLDSDLEGAAFDTLAVRAGQHRTAECEHSEALFMTSSYVFRSAEEAAARFAGNLPGNVYSRYTNPTVQTFEERIAALEGAEQAVATASGMSAVLALAMSVCRSGDHVLVSRSVFGTTTSLFDKYLTRFGVEVDFVPLSDIAAWEAACRAETKLFFIESPSNPLAELADIAAMAGLAHTHGALLAVDNSFCTPVLQQPLALGADVVIHSATKYLDGQGRGMGGVVAGRRQEMQAVAGFLRACGPTLSAFNAWLFLKGLETLRIRMQAHDAGALALARWLERQPGIERVYYAGLESHPQYELAARQQRGSGAVVSFDVRGGREAAWRFIDATRMISITTNLGDTKTTIAHPASTSHGRLTSEERAAAGIGENLIRVAVGLEDLNDIKRDLQRGLALL